MKSTARQSRPSDSGVSARAGTGILLVLDGGQKVWVEWEEREHPRDRQGRFRKKGAAGGTGPTEIVLPPKRGRLPGLPWQEPPPPGQDSGKHSGQGYANIAGLTNNELGDAVEKALHEKGLRDMHPGKRTGPLDVGFGEYGFEVKACSIYAGEYKNKLKGWEAESKRKQAEELGLRPGTIIAVVDADGTTSIYWRDGIGAYRLTPAFNYAGKVKIDLEAAKQSLEDAVMRALDGLFAYDPQQARWPRGSPGGKGGQWRSTGEAIASLGIEMIEPHGEAGISGGYTARLNDGRKVLVKDRLDWPGIRSNVDESRGPEHADAALAIADHFGAKTPRTKKRKTDELGEEAATTLQTSEVSVQEFVTGFREGTHEAREDHITEDEAMRVSVLDYVIGNTDRHRSQWGLEADGSLVAVDHDLTFPTGQSQGNIFDWRDKSNAPELREPGEPDEFGFVEEQDVVSDATDDAALIGRPLSPELKSQLDDMWEHHAEWDERLEAIGLDVDERDGMWARVQRLRQEGTVLSPADFMDEYRIWPMYFEGTR